MTLTLISRGCKIWCSKRPLLGPINPYGNNVRHFKRIQSENTPGFEKLSTPFNNINIGVNNIGVARLWKPLGFTIAFSSMCFSGAVIWQYENLRSQAIAALKPFSYKWRSQHKMGELRREFNKWWNNLTPGEKLFVPICLINVLVFAAWRIPKLQPFMLKYFCSNPGSQNLCLPMLLSTFSHYSAFHLFANMYVLHSFSSGAVASLGQEQFLGLYLSAGVVSSFASYLYKSITKQPGLSLGASGAIMAIIGYVCTQYPDTKLGIIFLPFLTFSAGSAIKVILALDTAGVILRWKIFDHAAHLGGAAFGIFWSSWGNENLWHKRDPILKFWHELRGGFK